MNIIIFDKNDYVSSTTVRLTGRRFEHIVAIHRAQEGDELRVGLLNGDIGQGCISKISDEFVDIDVNLFNKAPDCLPISLIVALPRPPTFKKVLESATAMGVKRFYFIHSKRVEKSFWQSPALKDEKVRHHMMLGLEQAGDTVMPEYKFFRGFKSFVEDELKKVVGSSRALIAHPYVDQICPIAVKEPLTLAVGPEGGFIPFELDMFREYGFEAVNMGSRILRVEHAVVALLARLYA